MAKLAFIAFGLLAVLSPSLAGPVNVRVETENTQNFHIGPEPRTRFELVEQYSPLATSKQVHQGQSVARALSSSLTKSRQPIRPPPQQPVQVIVDFGEAGRDGQQQQGHGAIGHPHQIAAVETGSDEAKRGPKMITRSQWLDWTNWSNCDGGYRMRIRKCLTINDVPCEGHSEDRQKCFSSQSSGIKFAQDPNIIEREIQEWTSGRS